MSRGNRTGDGIQLEMLKFLTILCLQLLPIIIGILSVLYNGNKRFGEFWDGLWCPLVDRYEHTVGWIRNYLALRKHRRAAGRCLKCGYNLLYNVSGICPECGTPIHENRC
jgi:hypothetical protein